MIDDIQRARDALQAIPPDIPRDDWVRVGMAAQAAGLDFETFDDWSADASNYDASAARDTWKSFTADGGVGAGTLFYVARSYGWGNGVANFSVEKTPPLAMGGAPATSAADVWRRCAPATGEHPYITAKQGFSEGLRVVPAGDSLRIAGESMVGALVVPVRCGGQLSSLQFIAPPDTAARLKAKGKPSKLNLPGCPVNGFHVVGELGAGAVVYVCEGIGQAWACYRATNSAAVVCFGWGRVRTVAEALRQRDKSASLVLVPDVGKEADAETIARNVGAAVVRMPEGWPNNSDVNDLMQRDGIELLAQVLANATLPPQRFKLLSGDDLCKLPPLQWRVRGVLPATGLAAIYGPSASGKSFLAFDLAAHIAEGCRWFDCRVESAPVIYCALEGEAGFKLRAAAWEKRQGHKLPARLQMILQSFNVTLPQDVQDLAAVLPVGAVVIIDTLNRAAPGCDENSSVDMGLIIEAAKRLQARIGGLVVLVHHSGKDSAKGLRGHSSLFAALDAVVEVSRDGDRREWRIAKSKDDADGIARPFKLEVVPLGFDGYGDPVTSCVIAPDAAAQDVQRVKLPQGGNQKLVFEAVRKLWAQSKPYDPAYPECVPVGQVAINLEDSLSAIAECLTCPSDKKTSRAREAITGLIGRGVLAFNQGWLWRA